MRLMFSFLLIALFVSPFRGEAAESCLLQNYIKQRGSVPSVGLSTREVTFTVPKPGTSGITVTRLLSSTKTSPRLKELLAFANENKIVLTKGEAPRISNDKTTYIGIPESAMKSEEALTAQIEAALVSYSVPLNLDRLPEQSRKLVLQMRQKHNTTFVQSRADMGYSMAQENLIGIKALHPDNLRVNDVVVHEITHNTTDRKVLEAFNPIPGKAPKPFTEALAGREMEFQGKYKKPLKHPIEGYDERFRADEVEAHIRELAQAKKDSQDLTRQLKETKIFIDTEQAHIRKLLEKDLSISTGDYEDVLKMGRKQRRIVTSPDGNFSLKILVPKGLDRNGEREFITAALKRRLDTLDGYRDGLKRFEKDLQTEFPGMQIEAPESIGGQAPPPVDLQTEFPGIQIEPPEAIVVASQTSSTSLGAKLRAAGFERDLTEPSPGKTNFSQVIAGSVPNPDGSRSLIMRDSGREFSEIHDLDKGIYRGSPDWMIDGMGAKAADFFGVKVEKKNLARIPDATGANISIDTFNSGIPKAQQIPVRYYKPSVDRVTPREYIDRFIKTGELPIASNGTEAIHDVIYHYFPLLYMPPKLLALHKNQMKMMLEFQDFIKAKHPQLFDEISIKTELGPGDTAVKLEYTENVVSRTVDAFTSEPLGAFEKFRNERYADSGNPGTLNTATTAMNNYLYGGASPVAMIRGLVKSDKPEVKAALEEFLKQVPASDSGARNGLTITPESMEKEILERVKFVNSRAESLK